MRLIKRQAAVKLQMELKHVNPAQIAGTQIVNAAAEAAVVDQIENVLPHFFRQLLVHQQGNRFAGNLVGIDQKIKGNKQRRQRIKPVDFKQSDHDQADHDRQVGGNVYQIVGTVRRHCQRSRFLHHILLKSDQP